MAFEINKKPIIIAGPCSVESEEQIMKIAQELSKRGIKFLRGGAYKPRTSPDSFQGLGKKGAMLLKKAADKHGMKTVSEVLTIEQLKESFDYIDIIQIGARNMASFGLLKEIGELTAEDKKPIIFKRGFGSTIKEFVAASGYLSDKGNENIIFCLRGIRTFEQSDSSFRFTPDIASVIELKEKSSYPVIFDPSHSGGKRKYVKDLSVAALSIGADGLIVEVHDNPDSALSDKDQQLNFDEFNSLMDELEKIILSNRSFQNQV